MYYYAKSEPRRKLSLNVEFQTPPVRSYWVITGKRVDLSSIRVSRSAGRRQDSLGMGINNIKRAFLICCLARGSVSGPYYNYIPSDIWYLYLEIFLLVLLVVFVPLELSACR